MKIIKPILIALIIASFGIAMITNSIIVVAYLGIAIAAISGFAFWHIKEREKEEQTNANNEKINLFLSKFEETKKVARSNNIELINNMQVSINDLKGSLENNNRILEKLSEKQKALFETTIKNVIEFKKDINEVNTRVAKENLAILVNESENIQTTLSNNNQSLINYLKDSLTAEIISEIEETRMKDTLNINNIKQELEFLNSKFNGKILPLLNNSVENSKKSLLLFKQEMLGLQELVKKSQKDLILDIKSEITPGLIEQLNESNYKIQENFNSTVSSIDSVKKTIELGNKSLQNMNITAEAINKTIREEHSNLQDLIEENIITSIKDTVYSINKELQNVTKSAEMINDTLEEKYNDLESYLQDGIESQIESINIFNKGLGDATIKSLDINDRIFNNTDKLYSELKKGTNKVEKVLTETKQEIADSKIPEREKALKIQDKIIDNIKKGN